MQTRILSIERISTLQNIDRTLINTKIEFIEISNSVAIRIAKYSSKGLSKRTNQ